LEFELKPVDRLFYDNEVKKRLLVFKLNPVSREHYNDEISIVLKRKGKTHRQLKFDELEIEYYKRIGIER